MLNGDLIDLMQKADLEVQTYTLEAGDSVLTNEFYSSWYSHSRYTLWHDAGHVRWSKCPS